MNPPLVTLTVTTLNRPAYLRETLSAVLAQDYPNLDVLVSDNGSKDETPRLAQEMTRGDPRVRFRRNETTVGICEHFTQCVFAARGEYFILLSDDDRINPTFVTEMVGVTQRHEGVQVVVPANVTIDEKGDVIEAFVTPEGEVFDGPEFVCNWLYKRTPQPFAAVVTVMTRTAVLRHFGGYQPFTRGQNVDNLLFLQAAIGGRVGFARRAIFNWRVYNRSYGTTSTPRQIARASHEFVHHLKSDRPTREALAKLPPARAREIVDGVRIMTAQEYLFRIGFYDNPYRWQTVRRVFTFGFDRLFFHVVLREYYHRLRRAVRPAGSKAAAST